MRTPRPHTPGTSTDEDAGPTRASADIGWLRAILSGVAIVATAFVGAVVLPNIVVVQLDGLTTFTRSILATFLTIVVVVILAWGLRRLQARRII